MSGVASGTGAPRSAAAAPAEGGLSPRRLTAPRRARRKAEPVIALINVVFLMLIFFLLAGTLAKVAPGDIRLVSLSDGEMVPPPDALVIRPDATVLRDGTAIPLEAALADQVGQVGPLRLMPDRDLPAVELARIAAQVRAAGITDLRILAEREVTQ